MLQVKGAASAGCIWLDLHARNPRAPVRAASQGCAPFLLSRLRRGVQPAEAETAKTATLVHDSKQRTHNCRRAAWHARLTRESPSSSRWREREQEREVVLINTG